MSTPARQPLTLTLGPHHLRQGAPAAMAALLIADRIVTLMPAPTDGESRDDVAEAVTRAPHFLRLMEAWRWTMPLWRSGLISSTHEQQPVGEALARVRDIVESEPAMAPLRQLVRADPLREDHDILNAMCEDILKGGTRPWFSITLAAAIDRFTLAHTLVGVRPEARSVTEKTEMRLARRVASFAMPILVRASVAQITLARDLLAEQLDALRAALIVAFEGAGTDDVDACAGRLADELDAIVPQLISDEDDTHPAIGYVAISIVRFPADTALRCGMITSAGMLGVRPEPLPHDPKAGEFNCLIIRSLKARPAR